MFTSDLVFTVFRKVTTCEGDPTVLVSYFCV